MLKLVEGVLGGFISDTHTHMCIYRMSLPNGVEAMFLGKKKPLTIPALLANSCFLFNFKSLGETPP